MPRPDVTWTGVTNPCSPCCAWDVSDRFQGLSEQERAACLIAERVLGVVAEPWDVDGRQGVVDAMLTYPTGRRAAFEVTALSGDGALQTLSLLSRDQFQWPLPGQWTWTVEVGSAADLPQLRGRYVRIALLCEAAGLSRPEQLWQRQISVDPDPDIAWLLEHSTSDMVGHPDLPAIDGNRVRSATVLPASRGGAVDESLSGLRQALEDAFAEPHMVRHLDKTARADTDERHLFLPVHWSVLPFPVFYGLLDDGQALPPEPPPLPPAITHLWLAPELARRVLLWTPHGWQNHYPYDN
ncbi:hypothetical protein GCM10011594_39750 [Nakamurella endophytica]|uniref:Uncharacterized protein n=1 Tax=Nakamurella endophytica TaxID=1748367 RepID=A0A917T9T0_9ACTN|nr:hypothetical protein GCM10011594_39750 [Nakamurella endophytica]